MQQIQLTEYIMHIGDTGAGIGVALIWTASAEPPSEAATIGPAPGDGSALIIDDATAHYILPRMDPRCRSMALAEGLHILWQRAGSAEIMHRRLQSV